MSTNELGTLPGTIDYNYTCTCLYGRYTGKYRRVLCSSSGPKKKISGWFTASVPKRHDHHRRFNSRTLLARNLDLCPDPFLSWAIFSDLAEFNFGSGSPNPPICQISLPNFLVIRYIKRATTPKVQSQLQGSNYSQEDKEGSKQPRSVLHTHRQSREVHTI